MDIDIEALKRKRASLSGDELREFDEQIKKALRNFQRIIDESERVIEIADNAPKILDDLDREFEEKTQLKGIDMTFLFLATALQCARQYLLPDEKTISDYIRGRPRSKEALMVTHVSDNQNWREILASPSVPYDAKAFPDGTSCKFTALAHDPIAGWIFGPVNILTETLTTPNTLKTYGVEMPIHENETLKKINKLIPKSRFVRNMLIMESVPTSYVFSSAISRVQSDAMNLPAAVARHAARAGFNHFAVQGLPAPFMDTMRLLNNTDGKIYQDLLSLFHTDMRSIIRGAAVSAFINALISCIHSLFYNPEQYTSPRVYQVKTKRIINLSNFIASSSNIIYTAVSKDLSRLDIGGLLVTLNRLINDRNFKREVKAEFITESFGAMIRGKELDLE